MKILRRELTFLWPFRWWVALAVLLGCATIASGMSLLGMSAYLISASALETMLIALSVPIFIVRFTGAFRAVFRYCERLTSHYVTFKALSQMRSWIYGHLEPLAPALLLRERSGDLLSRLLTDVDELQNIYLRATSPLMIALLVALLTFGLFAIFSLSLAWIAVLFLALTGLGLPLLIGRLTRGLGRRELQARGELNARIVDGVQGVQDVLASGNARKQVRQISILDQALTQVQRRMALISGLQQALTEFLMNISVFCMLVLAIPLVTSRQINSVYLAFLTLLLLASFEAIQPLGQSLQSLGHSIVAGERIFEITDAEPAVSDPPSPLVPIKPEEGHTLVFEDLHFAYTSAGPEVLHGINLALTPGRHVAVVGPSGSGKSTLVRLALRFWDPTQGHIYLNKQDLRDYAQDELRAIYSVVSQDTYLFNDTLRGNLRLARPGATEQELTRAIEQAQLSDFIASQPQGLDTWIGEQGLRLSGGERQRLAIARALLKDAPLLILDEATANLDPLTEQALLSSLDLLMRGRTTLMVTHRLVEMERMDEILVLEAGQVRERGTHTQLVEQGGLYYQLVDLQNGLLPVS